MKRINSYKKLYENSLTKSDKYYDPDTHLINKIMTYIKEASNYN